MATRDSNGIGNDLGRDSESGNPKPSSCLNSCPYHSNLRACPHVGLPVNSLGAVHKLTGNESLHCIIN